jgi:DNA-binding transcriptional ArsR family regulator
MNKTGELDTAHLTELSDFLKALAGETRQQILTLFACSPEERTVNQIAEELGIGQSTASENLTALRRTGVLTARRSGKTVFYRPDRARALFLVDQLRAYLTTCCPAGPE